ncbi:MAG: LysM peptidoglycan-binding domain-containing protein [Treponema sp.]|nr:LysM peptidoglycan-binding domain-containing protein [Treponema sp.]
MKSLVSNCVKKVSFCVLITLVTGIPLIAAQASATYTVEKGDTLYSISRKYGVSVAALRSENNIKSDNIIFVGQKLSIPGSGSEDKVEKKPAQKTEAANVKQKDKSQSRQYDVYTVQRGDTFYNIAKVNDISVAKLKELNSIDDESKLRIGQKLKIPVSYVDTDNAKLPDLPSSDPRKYSEKLGDSSLTWPVEKPTVTYTEGKVSGVHLSAKDGETVKCIRAGIVMYTGSYRGYGQVVFVQTKADYIYAYTGLASTSVQKGDYVVFGDKLGEAGKDSIKGSSQISLMVFLNSKPIDPAKAPRG